MPGLHLFLNDRKAFLLFGEKLQGLNEMFLQLRLRMICWHGLKGCRLFNVFLYHQFCTLYRLSKLVEFRLLTRTLEIMCLCRFKKGKNLKADLTKSAIITLAIQWLHGLGLGRATAASMSFLPPVALPEGSNPVSKYQLETLWSSPPIFLLAVRNPQNTLSQGSLPTLEAVVAYLPQLNAVGQEGFGTRRLECDSGLVFYWQWLSISQRGFHWVLGFHGTLNRNCVSVSYGHW